jgi:hypothetical protein
MRRALSNVSSSPAVKVRVRRLQSGESPCPGGRGPSAAEACSFGGRGLLRCPRVARIVADREEMNLREP